MADQLTGKYLRHDALPTLRAHLKIDGSVEVQGYLQFTKGELEDFGHAILSVATKRPHDYVPPSRKAKQ